ncbi:hypothetical protein [Chondrinema litorale]|uniref:hypothetical protein n=1 Tax=Chondrinema litorale TaxID=2994555 RepID=UPI002542C72D|nr:hypothetical protein [Chondrinema litorale]UZS00040.1 hypothetical protein OQ292_39555 [Chondrinema litorale]
MGITVCLTVGVIIYNILVDPSKEFVHTGKLLNVVLISIVGLMLEIARNWFLTSKIKSKSSLTLIDLLGATTVMSANTSEEVDQKAREISDYLDDNHDQIDEELKEQLKNQINRKIGKNKSLRFGGTDIIIKCNSQDLI